MSYSTNSVTIIDGHEQYRFNLKKKIEIRYKGPTLFSRPHMELERFHSLTPFLKKKEYTELLEELENILYEASIPIWQWVLLFIFTLGLFSWYVIIRQKKKTRNASEKLKNLVREHNQSLVNKIKESSNSEKYERSQLMLFEIPFPSKDNVILHACFYEKFLDN